MTIYEITLSVTEYYTFKVRADSREDAETGAESAWSGLQMADLPDYRADRDPECEPLTVDVIGDEATGTIFDASGESVLIDDEDDEAPFVHTSCRHCELDIEGRQGDDEWRDRGNNARCNDGRNAHAPN